MGENVDVQIAFDITCFVEFVEFVAGKLILGISLDFDFSIYFDFFNEFFKILTYLNLKRSNLISIALLVLI
jgi:hypothetical protein